MKKWLLLCLLAWWPQVSRAGDVFSEPCARAGIPRELAVAIARQESSLNHLAINIQGHSLRPRSVGQALDYIRRAEAGKKSYDVGLMQINNQWFGKLGITAEELLDPQRNVEIGVHILAGEIRRHGFNWQAVGKYHSPDKERGRRYAWRVWRHYCQAQKSPPPMPLALVAMTWKHWLSPGLPGGRWRDYQEICLPSLAQARRRYWGLFSLLTRDIRVN